MGNKLSNLFVITLLCGLIFLGLSIIQEQMDENLTIDEILNKEFYVYLLPNDIVKSEGWEQTILMYSSFDEHCYQEDTIYRGNPIIIQYRNEKLNSQFSIAIEPILPGVWNSQANDIRQEIVQIDFIKGGGIEYYTIEDDNISKSDVTSFRFEDDIGMQVIINVWNLSVTESLSLISRLEYSGPDKTVVGNPWQKICE